MNIDITLISARDRIRPQINEAHVQALKDSIAEVGLLNPITVCKSLISDNGIALEGYRLIAGAHRLEACKWLGLAEIPAHIVELSSLQREIAECDENLCGATLTRSERALFTNRRRIAWEALHPETKHGGNQGEDGRFAPCRQVGDTGTVLRFTKETAERTGRSERSVQRDTERGEKIDPGAIALLRGSRLADNGSYLDNLKRFAPSEQIAKVTRDIATAAERRPKTNEEVVDDQCDRLMRAWDTACPEARERFLIYIDAPVMDADSRKAFG